ncbi:hypothetical protein D4764_12G0006210 [Takifugu flavidus]|uniref:Uncharacterized protein n=1 Tax=Takifugu flavidus TaxID=433684 RepID=A0A5C6PEJ2_9TELE|nr:hypothetical protein D4764_12G0006210 [Takifugu flavidus]
MLKPRNLGDEPLLRDSPQVFGKPWFWQRCSGAVDSSRGLACVIMEMRDEIKKLEAENRQLRADCHQLSSGDDPGEAEQQPEENPHLRRNVSAPVLKGQNQETTIMTVRRYSANGSLAGVSERERERGPDRDRRCTTSGWRRLEQEIHLQDNMYSNPTSGEEDLVPSRCSLQEYMHKNRAKVKTVTFLLPVDDIYTNRPVLSKDQNGSRITELASIRETDS